MTLFLNLADWALLFGRLHPLVVHLPIGFLLMGFLLEIFARYRKNATFHQVTSFVLLCSFGSAVLACVFGYLLSLGGEYDKEALQTHQYLGIALAVLAGIVWWLGRPNVPVTVRKAYFPAFAMSVLLLSVTGHYGGNLTHGADYLAQPVRNITGIGKSPTPVAVAKPKSLNETIVYAHLIEPILQQKCYACHNDAKQKGSLRMDSPDFLTKGGKHGVIFVSGKATESEMVKRVLLPESDELHMPPKGKTPLTDEEIALLKWWIDAGSSFTKKVPELQASEDIKKILTAHAGTAETTQQAESAVFSKKVPPADAKVELELRKAGILVTPVANGSAFLEVSFVNAAGKAQDWLPRLAPLAEQVVWLKLGYSNVSDKSLTTLTAFKNLTKLSLEHTTISDAGLTSLSGLPYLEYLNLYGTRVSDAGLKALENLKSLQKLYVWQTRVTEQGIIQLKTRLPSLQADLGWKEQRPDSTTASIK